MDDLLVIVIDNNSGDGTSTLVDRYISRRLNIYSFDEMERGVCKGLNTGLAYVGSGWVARMDPDDIWLTGPHQLVWLRNVN